MGGGGGCCYGGRVDTRDEIREHVRQIVKLADNAMRDLGYLESGELCLFDGAFVRQDFRAMRREIWEMGNPIRRILKHRQQRKATANAQNASETSGD